MASTIYRDFSRYYPEGSDEHVYSNRDVGGILVDLIEGHKLFVSVRELHSNGCCHYPLDDGYEAYLHVTVDPSIDLYDAINVVMDKITEDHRYQVKESYKDFILCFDDIMENAPQLCHDNGDGDRTSMGGKWTYFTREAFAYVGFDEKNSAMWENDEIAERWATDKSVYIDGEVKLGDDGQPKFTYDYPIISSGTGQRYYELTRGKRVTEVKYSDLYPGDKDFEEFLAMNPHYHG